MKRKVIQIGDFTKVVSLPREWTKKYKVERGDELNIDENGSTIIISQSDSKKSMLTAEADLRGVDKEIVWPLLALMHKIGYNEISIKFDNPEVLGIIRKKNSSALMGFEVIDQTKNSCFIKNITEGTKTELDSLVKKIFSVTLCLSNNTLYYLRTSDTERLDELLSLEETNNKLSNLCERMLNTAGLDINNRYLYIVVWLLESIADDYKELCNLLKTKKKLTVSRETIQLYEKANNLFENYHALFYTFSLKGMATFIKNQKHLTKELMESAAGNKDEHAIISTLLVISKKMGNFIGATLALKAQIDTKV
jgi:phosphate uptake regulator